MLSHWSAGRTGATLLSALLLLALAPAGPAVAQDNAADAAPLVLDDASIRAVAFEPLTVEPGERFTASGAGLCDGEKMRATAWFTVRGTGAPVTVRVNDLDEPVVAVYRAPASGLPGIDALELCRRDSPEYHHLELAFASVAGQRYLIQVGQCATGECEVNLGYLHNTQVRAKTRPPNDDRTSAEPLTIMPFPLSIAPSAYRDTLAATAEPTEPTVCDHPTVPHPQKTVWYRYQAHAPGQLSLHAQVTAATPAGQWVLELYRESVALSCDQVPPRAGAPVTTAIDVVPGSYYFRVRAVVGEDIGAVGLVGAFVENVDVDGDGIAKPADCQDADPAIRPGAVDVPGNRIDEDCSGADAAYPRVAGAVRAVWQVSRNSTRLRSLQVSGLSEATTVTVRCRGGKRLGCAFTKTTRTYRSKPAKTIQLAALFKGRSLRKDAVVEVLISRRRHVSRLWRYTARPPRAALTRVYCQAPGASTKRRC